MSDAKDQLISVIIPVYNVAHGLTKCIESVLNQSYPDWELILVDDCSTDDSGKICDEYAGRDSRIKAFHNAVNSGVSKTRNAGISFSKGDIITFIDSDDYVDDTYLENMNSDMEQNVEFAIYGVQRELEDGTVTSRDNGERVRVPHRDIGSVIPQLNLGYAVAKAYRASTVKEKEIKFNENFSLGEDTLFAIDYLLEIEGDLKIGNLFYHYVDWNPNSLSKKYVANVVEVHSAIYDAKKKLEKFAPFVVETAKEEVIAKMDIVNIYRPLSPLSKKEKLERVKKYMNDPTTRRAIVQTKKTDAFSKVLKYTFALKSPKLLKFLMVLAMKRKK